MTEAKKAGPLEIVIVRRFAAPRALVFRSWTEANGLKAWFAPDGFSTTLAAVEARRGGKWRVEYRSRSGVNFVEHGTIRDIKAPERLVLTLTQEMAGRAHSETTITITLAEIGRQTEMTFRQTGFDSTERRDGNAEGWAECFDKLQAHLATA